MSTIKKIANSGISTSIETRSLSEIQDHTGNVYQSISIISKRSVQIGKELKDELYRKLSDYQDTSDSNEDMIENKEQQELSKYYEKMASPAILAIEEFLQSETHWENPVEEESETN